MVLGVGSLWFARLARIPSIVVLLLAGIVAGPVTGVVDPEALFGDTLDPAVSLAVGLLLFDSGQRLQFRKLTTGRRAVRRLVLVGGLITWLGGWIAAYLLFDLSVEVAALLGAVLIVSGPTVIEPILSLSRAREPIDTVLRWEGTILDPIGGALGIAVFSAITAATVSLGPVAEMAMIAGVGVGIGLLCAGVFLLAQRHRLIPYDLQVAIAFMLAVLAFTVANGIFTEAGLFATLTLGLALANQTSAPTREIQEFQAVVGTLIVAVLFVVLAATIDLDGLREVLLPSAFLLLVLVLVVRPVAAFIASLRTDLAWRDRAFAACVAPRGIVAASTASFYVIALPSDMDGEQILPITFAVIIGAGVVYGFGSPVMARVLGVARSTPHGVALVADPWVAIPIANALTEADVDALVVTGRPRDTAHTEAAVEVYSGNVRSPDFDEALARRDVGTAVISGVDPGLEAETQSRLSERLGSQAVFSVPHEQYATKHRRINWSIPPQSRIPFAPEITCDGFAQLIAEGEPTWIDPIDGAWPTPADATPLFIVTADEGAVVATPRALTRSPRVSNDQAAARLLVWTAPRAGARSESTRR